MWTQLRLSSYWRTPHMLLFTLIHWKSTGKPMQTSYTALQSIPLWSEYALLYCEWLR